MGAIGTMNLLNLIAVAGGGLVALWLVQTLILTAVGAKQIVAWPMRYDSESTVVRWVMKTAVQGVLLSLLLLPPWLTGESPLDYLVERLSTDNRVVPVV